MDNSPSLSQKLDNSPMIGGKGNMPARSFMEAIRYLGNKADRPYTPGSPRYTRVIRTENGIGVKYHNTVVVEYTEAGIVLNCGGFRTVTTKARMNEALYAIENAPRVSQTRGVWYIGSLPYFDGVIISWQGEIVNGPADGGKSEVDRIVTTTRLINAYCKLAVETIERVYAMDENDYDPDVLPLPSVEDCWYCVMRTQSGETLGDAIQDDHLLDHMEKSYIVPSLLLNAMRERGSQYSTTTLYALMEGNSPLKMEFDWLRRDLPRALRSYLKARLSVGR